jgi:hypothetical protein
MPTQPLISIGELIDRSWDTLRSKPVPALSISGWLLVGAAIDVLALAFYPTVSKVASGATLNGSETFGVILTFVSGALIAPLLSVWIFASLAKLIDAQLAGRKLSSKEAMRQGRTLFLPSLLITALLAGLILLAVFIAYAPAATIALLAIWMSNPIVVLIRSLLLIGGTFVAVGLSFYWAVRYGLAPYALFLENIRGMGALMRSRTLADGRFFAVLSRLLIPKAVFFVLGVIVLAVLSYVANIAVSASAGLNIDVQLRLTSMVNAVMPILAAILINPLVVASDILLYRSLSQSRA